MPSRSYEDLLERPLELACMQPVFEMTAHEMFMRSALFLEPGPVWTWMFLRVQPDYEPLQTHGNKCTGDFKMFGSDSSPGGKEKMLPVPEIMIKQEYLPEGRITGTAGRICEVRL